jgi:ferritin-like metal-binding protein YciE
VKLFSANIEDLRTLYLTELKKALDMEQKITKALPTMIDKSTDLQLATAFRNHLEETRGHVNKVEAILQEATGNTDTKTCKVISALVTEAEDSIKDAGDENIRDITLIAAAQQVEHHEMAVYGTLRNWAELLGETQASEILDSILDEEKKADELLTRISDTVNTTASGASGTGNITGDDNIPVHIVTPGSTTTPGNTVTPGNNLAATEDGTLESSSSYATTR